MEVLPKMRMLLCSTIAETIICVTCVCAGTLALSFDWQYNLNSNTNCLSMLYRFRSFTDTSLQKCAKYCAIRPTCQALNYHSTYQLCDLLSQDFGEVSHHKPPCAMIKRSEIEIPLPAECEQCKDGEMCDINEVTASGTCVINECKPLHVENGHTLGNMYDIGSRVVYECNDGYTRITEDKLSVCQHDGNWSVKPVCVPVCPGIVLADGTIYPPPSTLNEEHLFEESCTLSSSYCHENGTWDSIPDCDKPVIALYLGCYLDCDDRLLIPHLAPMSPATIENCIDICSSKGYTYANTEYYDYCHCGNEVRHFTRVDDAQCDTPCNDNPNQMCGGGWRASLYDLSVQTGNYGIIHYETKCTPDGEIIG